MKSYNEDNAILSVHVPDNRVATHVKQKLTEMTGETDKSTIIVGNVGTPLSAIDREQIKRKSARTKKNSTAPLNNRI